MGYERASTISLLWHYLYRLPTLLADLWSVEQTAGARLDSPECGPRPRVTGREGQEDQRLTLPAADNSTSRRYPRSSDNPAHAPAACPSGCHGRRRSYRGLSGDGGRSIGELGHSNLAGWG